MIDVLKAFLATLLKMFAADLWLTLIALGSVALCAAGLRSGIVRPDMSPFLLALGVVAALVAGVAHGARW